MLHFSRPNIKIYLNICLVLCVFTSVSCQKEELSSPKDYAITCYTATYGNGIYKSDNGGISWFPINVDQQDIYAYFKRLYRDPFHLDFLYIATTGMGLFTFNLQTETFNKVEQFHDENVRSIAFRGSSSDPLNPPEILVGINDKGVYHSHDSSNEWQARNVGLYYRDINVLFAQKNIIFTGTEKDLFKWDEKTKQWVISSNGIKNKNIISIAADPSGKNFYSGSGGYEGGKGFPCLYKSIDQGNTWTPSNNGLPEWTLVYAIAINENRMERIYLGTSNGIYRSINNGTDWQAIGEGLPNDLRVYDIKITRMSNENDIVYAAGSKGIFMTEDNEKTLWKNKSFGLEPTAVTGIVLISD